MALIICPECGHQVSSAARECPQCGYPVGVIIKNDLVNNILQDATTEQLCLSLRSYMLLRRAGIKTVRDLCQCEASQLMKIRNLGKKSLEEIVSRLFDLGLCLRDDSPSGETIDFKTPATKYDWKCERAPQNGQVSSFECEYKPSELERLKLGFVPRNMEQKWFCYYENKTVHFYRSWTGTLVCLVILNEQTNKHIVMKYYSDEEEKETLEHIDAQKLIRCVIDGSWGWY